MAAITNGTIMYIEPNDLQDPKHDNIPFRTEDLCIALDMVVEIPSRYSQATGNNGSSMWINDTKQTISFLGGTDGMLTTSFTNISGNGSKGEGNKETLGIKSVKVEYNSYYFPTVSITFTDVRGSSLMEAQEEGYVDSLVNKDKIMSQGSFFRALFKFPYPVFHMKIKGFYGKPVEYDLVVSKFNTKFDSASGNFDVDVEFIGHMYGVYGDLPFKYILYAPYIKYPDTEGNSYWKAQVANGTYRFDNGKEMITFFELKDKIESVPATLSNALKGEIKGYRIKLKEIEDLKEIIKEYDKLIESFGTEKYRNRHIGAGNELGRYIFITEKNSNGDAKHDVYLYNNLNTKIEKYNGDWSRALPKFTDDWKQITAYTINCEKGEFKYENLKIAEEIVDAIKEEFGNERKAIRRDIFNHCLDNNKDQTSAEILGYFFNTHDFERIISERLEIITKNADLIKRKIIEEKNAKLVEAIGFLPSARNIVKLLYAHIDCFMHKVYSCIDLINNPRKGNKRTFNTIGFNVTNTDVRRNVGANSFVPPFPLTINERNVTVYPGELGGIKEEQMPELDLITAISSALLRQQRMSEGTIGDGFVKNLLSDLYMDDNPYLKMDSQTPNEWGDILVAYANRLYNKFALEVYSATTSTLKAFAYTEAYNVFQNIASDKDLLNKLTNFNIDYLLGGGEDNNSVMSEMNKGFVEKSGQSYYYDWMVRPRNSKLLTQFTNMAEAKQIYKTSDITGYQKNIYPLCNEITELYEDFPNVFRIRESIDVDKLQNDRETNVGYMKRFFDSSNDVYDEINGTKLFANSIIKKEQLSGDTYGIGINTDKWYEPYYGDCAAFADSAKTYVEYLTNYSKIKNANLTCVPFVGNVNLFKSDFYRNQNQYGRAMLFLQCMPFDIGSVLNKIPFENRIAELPYVVVLFMGGVLYYYNKGFEFNGGDSIKLPKYIPVFKNSENAYTINGEYTFDTESFAKDLGSLKWPVQYGFMNAFKTWVCNKFGTIDNNLSLGITVEEYPYFERLITNLAEHKRNNKTQDKPQYTGGTQGQDVCVVKYTIKTQRKDDAGNTITEIKDAEEYYLYYNYIGKTVTTNDGTKDAWDFITQYADGTSENRVEETVYLEWKRTNSVTDKDGFTRNIRAYDNYSKLNDKITSWVKGNENTAPSSDIILQIFPQFNKNVELNITKNGEVVDIDWGYKDSIGFGLDILRYTNWVYMLGNSRMDKTDGFKKYYLLRFDKDNGVKGVNYSNIGDESRAITHMMSVAYKENKCYGQWGTYSVNEQTYLGNGEGLEKKDLTIVNDGKEIKITKPGWFKYKDGENERCFYVYETGDLNIVFAENYNSGDYTNSGYAQQHNAIIPELYARLNAVNRKGVNEVVKNTSFIFNAKGFENVFKVTNISEDLFSYDSSIAVSKVQGTIAKPIVTEVNAVKMARNSYDTAKDKINDLADGDEFKEYKEVCKQIKEKEQQIIEADSEEKRNNLEKEFTELLKKRESFKAKLKKDNLKVINNDNIVIDVDNIVKQLNETLKKNNITTPQICRDTNGYFDEESFEKSDVDLDHCWPEYKDSFGIIIESVAHSSDSSDEQAKLGLTSDNLTKGVQYFNEALKKYSNYVTNNRVSSQGISKDILESTYLLVKSLYDRWLCGIPGGESFWSLDDKVNGERSEYKRFKFIDSYYNDIGDEILVNLTEMKSELERCMNGGTYSPSVYVFLANVNEKSKCLLIPSQAFGATTTLKDYEDLFKPMPYSVMASTRGTGPAYLWIYPGNPSTTYNGDGDYEPDSFDIADSTGRSFAPTLPEKLFDHKLAGTTIPAFGVSIGAQNQGFVKSIDISTTKFEQTEYSIKNSIAIADTYGKQPKAVNYLSQDLYRVYANYSYTVTAELLGNVNISPMMYFQLNNVPMFKGAYYVIKVSHNIEPGKMSTSITGVRISKNKVPLIDASDVIWSEKVEDVEIEDDANVLTETVEDRPVSLYKTKKDYTNSLPANPTGDGLTLLNTTEEVGDNTYKVIDQIPTVWGATDVSATREINGNYYYTGLITETYLKEYDDILKFKEQNPDYDTDNRYENKVINSISGCSGAYSEIVTVLYQIGKVALKTGYHVSISKCSHDTNLGLYYITLNAVSNDGYKTLCNNELFDMIACIYNDNEDVVYLCGIGLVNGEVRLTFNIKSDKNGIIKRGPYKKYLGLYKEKNGNEAQEYFNREWLADAESYPNTINEYIHEDPMFVGTLAYVADENNGGSINSTLYNYARINGREKRGMIEELIKEHNKDILRG